MRWTRPSLSGFCQSQENRSCATKSAVRNGSRWPGCAERHSVLGTALRVAMRIPPSLEPLVEIGVVQEVLRPLMSGKEAQLYVVVAGGQERVAKVYKEAALRSFKQRTDYTDGRKVRNSRDRRAMTKRTRHGRAEEEAAWRSAEVDAIYKLQAAGVRVPAPYNFMDGVLLMELVTDAEGNPAPRLGDLTFSADEARAIFDRVLQDVVRMLCAGVVHGDLSDFNILMGADGPVIIDFPQAVDPASNSSARRLLLRDVDNLHRFVSRFATHHAPPFAQEMWNLFERSELTPETRLRGQFRDRRPNADTKEVMGLIGDAQREQQRRGGGRPGRGQAPQGRQGRRGSGGSGGGRGRNAAPQVEVLVRSAGRTRSVQPATAPATSPKPATEATPTANPADAPAKKRRRRRRRRSPGQGSGRNDAPNSDRS